MRTSRLVILAAAVALAGCGRVTDLRPAPGQSLPVKPLMARATPTPNDLLKIPPYAKPDRVDELVKRSQPRQQDPFDLPPPTGGSAPSQPAASVPVSNGSSSTTPGD
jgi:hypothetical protein